MGQTWMHNDANNHGLHSVIHWLSLHIYWACAQRSKANVSSPFESSFASLPSTLRTFSALPYFLSNVSPKGVGMPIADQNLVVAHYLPDIHLPVAQLSNVSVSSYNRRSVLRMEGGF